VLQIKVRGVKISRFPLMKNNILKALYAHARIFCSDLNRRPTRSDAIAEQRPLFTVAHIIRLVLRAGVHLIMH